jgi:uncharacterized membrane protein
MKTIASVSLFERISTPLRTLYYKSPQETHLQPEIEVKSSRIESIDFLRGIVMVIMALDHVRIYFFYGTYFFSPTDLEQTSPGIFATRLITHLCAPTFILLAGTSAYFTAQRKSKEETAFFLLTRGVWLIALQMTIVQFAWHFDPAFHHITSNIISTIGFSMVFLSLLIRLRLRLILWIGLVIVMGHNLLDGVAFEEGSVADMIWSFFHASKRFSLGHQYILQFSYPVIPWIGVIALGYCMGRLFDPDFSLAQRKKVILNWGVTCLIVFVVLRSLNIYGDLHPWSQQDTLSKTIMSFLNLEKYPPSLDYLCLTLGISLILLGLLEGRDLQGFKPITTFGNVALFYYVLHLFVIHLFAMLAVTAYGFPWHTMVFLDSPSKGSSLLKGNFGFNLFDTYLVWIFIVAMLYPPCKYWYSFKKKNKSKWWVSYV